MIIVIKPEATPQQLKTLSTHLEGLGQVRVERWHGAQTTVWGLIGDTAAVDVEWVRAQPGVESVKRIQEPYTLAGRAFRAEDTVVKVGSARFGGGTLSLIAGPCSVEDEASLTQVAGAVKRAGATVLRGGAFKPRSSPYVFQGLRDKGLTELCRVGKQVGLPVVTEILSPDQLPLFDEVDMIQVGARNMQNYELLKVLGQCGKPVLLKRGFANTVEEWLMSAEYLLAAGNRQVVLCERGIRTFETATRNTLDISAVPLVKQLTHLPVIVDPSHAAGRAELVEPLALAAVAAGADGLMIEVHPSPAAALSDGAQALTPDQFDGLAKKVAQLAPLVGKTVG